MQLRLPLWYIWVLLCAFLLKGRAAPIFGNGLQSRDDDHDDDDDSDDGDDGDNDDNSQHHHASSTTQQPSGVGKGAIAGIVIGCLLLLLLVGLLGWWCVRRARRQARLRYPVAVTVPNPPSMRQNLSSPVQGNPYNPFAVRPQSTTAQSAIHATPAATLFFDGAPQGQILNGNPIIAAHASPAADSLPNPYDQDIPPPVPPRDRRNVVSLASTAEPTSLDTSSSPTSHSRSYSYSAAPSAWTHEESSAPLLSRDSTQTSRLTASSSLHQEIVGYQKALEAHYRKEEDDAEGRPGGIGGSSALQEDPPPVYRDRDEQ
ncbi:hypothetical protein C8Q70DRAFT_1057157 [Cubamyces menziesii]|uniref:Mid2 domain-containing protein n=1 Tax=Trametes cubensis TaxID=1111947 RepID=A0AAD7TXZ8_9APHY|nr:hypothetical protein C8Q70DRAFT_1057157 [Cubamyces menziesii]KAJ8488894.1 hypothetical protein ONZ51_g3258 [Trametes cubensis]